MWSKALRTLFFVLCLGTQVFGQRIETIELAYSQENYPLVLKLADSLLESTSKMYHPRLFQLRADAYYFLGNLESSIESYFKAINSGEKAEVRDERLLIECYGHAGFCYREMGLYQQAFPHYAKSLLLSKEINDSVEIATQYYNLGTLHQYVGDFETSIKMLDSAYQIDLIRKDSVSIGFDLTLLSELKSQLGEHDQALYYAKESVDMYKAGTGNLNSLANRLNLVGSYFLELNQLDSAGYYMRLAEQELMKINDHWRLASCWLDLAKLKLKQNQLKEAEEFARKADNFFSGKGDNQYSIDSENLLARIYGEMLLLPKAWEILIQTEKKCMDQGLAKSLINIYLRQSEIAEKMGEPEQAKNLLQKHKMMKDSLQKLDNQEQLNRLALQVKFDKLERENQILITDNVSVKSTLQEKDARINWLIYGSALAILGLILVLILIRQRLVRRNLLLEEEVAHLRQQIKVVLEGDTSDLEVDLSKINECLTSPLTDREFEILGYAIGDLNNSQIAERVFVSVNTVKYHLKNIYEKLGVSNRKQALEYVVRAK